MFRLQAAPMGCKTKHKILLLSSQQKQIFIFYFLTFIRRWYENFAQIRALMSRLPGSDTVQTSSK